MCTGGMMMETNNRVWGLVLIAMLLLMFAGAYYEEETVAVSAPVLLAQQGEVSVYAGAIDLPAGENVQFSRRELLQGHLLCVSASSPLPEDMPVQQAHNVRSMVGLYVPAAQSVSLCEEAVYALCDLCAENPLIRTWITDGVRSPSQQRALQNQTFESYRLTMSTQAALAAARRDVPDSGKSEHQLATVFDVQFTGTLDWSKPDTLERSADGVWLKENAWKYGFIRRYSPEKAQITGVLNEEAHFRYVGREHALVMHLTSWCLEEYLQALADYGALTILQNDEISYILSRPMDAQGAAFSVPQGYSCTVSADNLGYAVCLLGRN